MRTTIYHNPRCSKSRQTLALLEERGISPRIVDYLNLDAYLRDLYHQPGIAETVNFDHIKRHYYFTHDDINPTRIVPIGPALDLDRPHGRERLAP